MNNYEFWENYLKRIKKQIIKLTEEKETLKIDLHIHSIHSADGKQTIKAIIESTRKLGFDVISITDHDTLSAYDEIYEYVKNGDSNPIIVPGIEFTIDNCEYGNQCHMLQLFINPKDKVIMDDVKKNHQAMFNRSKIQFERLNDNLAAQEIFNNNDIKVSYDEYIEYLNTNNMVPEYDTIASYILEKLQEKGITVFDLLRLAEKYNELDCYQDRKQLKRESFKKTKEKYPEIVENFYSIRVLISTLAVRTVDDDWWGKPSSGSLSVNSYGQLRVEDINDKYDIYFAHPTESKLGIVDKIITSKKNIIGIELNIRNKYENISDFYSIIKKHNLLETIGSDSHDSTLSLYENLEFYNISSEKLKKMLK